MLQIAQAAVVPQLLLVLVVPVVEEAGVVMGRHHLRLHLFPLLQMKRGKKRRRKKRRKKEEKKEKKTRRRAGVKPRRAHTLA
jgi:hypothetical protein